MPRAALGPLSLVTRHALGPLSLLQVARAGRFDGDGLVSHSAEELQGRLWQGKKVTMLRVIG